MAFQNLLRISEPVELSRCVSGDMVGRSVAVDRMRFSLAAVPSHSGEAETWSIDCSHASYALHRSSSMFGMSNIEGCAGSTCMRDGSFGGSLAGRPWRTQGLNVMVPTL